MSPRIADYVRELTADRKPVYRPGDGSLQVTFHLLDRWGVQQQASIAGLLLLGAIPVVFGIRSYAIDLIRTGGRAEPWSVACLAILLLLLPVLIFAVVALLRQAFVIRRLVLDASVTLHEHTIGKPEREKFRCRADRTSIESDTEKKTGPFSRQRESYKLTIVDDFTRHVLLERRDPDEVNAVVGRLRSFLGKSPTGQRDVVHSKPPAKRFWDALLGPTPLSAVPCLRTNAIIGALALVGGILAFAFRDTAGDSPFPSYLLPAQLAIGGLLACTALAAFAFKALRGPVLVLHGFLLLLATLSYPLLMLDVLSKAIQGARVGFSHAPGILAVATAYGTRLVLQFGNVVKDAKRIRRLTLIALIVGALLDISVLATMFWAFPHLTSHMLHAPRK